MATKFVAITLIESRWRWNKFAIEFELRGKNISETDWIGARMCTGPSYKGFDTFGKTLWHFYVNVVVYLRHVPALADVLHLCFTDISAAIWYYTPDSLIHYINCVQIIMHVVDISFTIILYWYLCFLINATFARNNNETQSSQLSPDFWASRIKQFPSNYSDVIMSAMASQIAGVSIIYSTVCSGADQIKHQSFASLGFLRGIHRWLINSPHKGPATRKMHDDVIMHLPHPYINDGSQVVLVVAYSSHKIEINPSPLGQNRRHFADNPLQMHFHHWNKCILIRISLKFVPVNPIDKKSALVQVMVWRRTGGKPLPEPMLTQFTDAYMRHKGIWVS